MAEQKSATLRDGGSGVFQMDCGCCLGVRPGTRGSHIASLFQGALADRTILSRLFVGFGEPR